MEMKWSRWFRCESSFGLLLVPNQPGIYALAEEVVAAGPQSRRMLAVFEVEESGDLARSLSRLFAVGSPWRERLGEGKCFLRYSVVADADQRRAAAASLKEWLSAQRDSASQFFDGRAPAIAVDEEEAATVSERAVDRVYKKIFPARA